MAEISHGKTIPPSSSSPSSSSSSSPPASPRPPPRHPSPSSSSPWDPEPGFAVIDGDINGRGYNETAVDIIAVPCIGASPIDTWARDPLSEGYFSYPTTKEPDRLSTVRELPGSTPLSPTIDRVLPPASHLWIRQGIRKEVSTARVMLYRHRELAEDTTLDRAADDLLEQVVRIRTGLTKSRPLFFVCHSIGGLVAKLALVKASRDQELRSLVYDCHGITFFATPHRGSSYMSMPNLREAIQQLLFLQKPLPRSITDELRLGYGPLLQLHDQFTDFASELKIWTFYETVESQLSGLGGSNVDEVHFVAPLTSIKSCLIGTRAEQALSLESDHAHCASFGPHNIRTMHSYLDDLSQAVQKAEYLSTNFVHTPLRLASHVKLELIGFYEDPDSETGRDTRLYVSKHHLDEFLHKGPERCLQERLLAVAAKPQKQALPLSRHLTVPSLSTPGFHRPWSQGNDGSGSNSGGTTRRTQTEPAETDVSPKTIDGRQQFPSHLIHSESSGLEEMDHAWQDTGRGRPDRVSHGSALQYLTAGFSRPDPTKRSFMWIHLPFNNPYWVKKIFDKLSETQDQSYSRLLSNENWTSRHVQGRHANLNASYVKPGCAFVPAELPRSPSPNASDRSISPGFQPSHFYLFLPYLHYDTYISMVRRRDIIRRRMRHGRARPVPSDIAELESLEARVIWEFIGHDPPLNTRRTLDQYGYPSLRDTYARDDDQMLYKLTKEKLPMPVRRKRDVNEGCSTAASTAVSPATRLYAAAETFLTDATATPEDTSDDVDLEADVIDGNVLMVDQLWLWAVDTTTLMTFFPKRESHPTEGPLFQQADLRNSIYNELNGDLTGRCENALDLAAFVVLHAVTVLIDRTSHPDLEVFRIFEEAVGTLTERMTASLKEFRMQTYANNVHDLSSDSDSDDPEANKSENIKRRHKKELERAERQNRENTSAVLELRDMEDELNTLKNLFDEQTATIEVMLASYEKPELQSVTTYGREFLREALKRLEEYKKQAHDMAERVDATKRDYEKLQEMLLRQAQVDEVRWSRLQTELASSQNLSVMIFTIFTVLFLPLSFFTSVFGMNTKEWGGPDANTFPTLGEIGAIALPISTVIIIVTLLAAFSSRVQHAFYATWKLLQSGRRQLARLRPRASQQAAERRRRQQREDVRGRRAARQRERGYDFWAAVRAQRRSRYDIPETNRRTAVLMGRRTTTRTRLTKREATWRRLRGGS
ncbi:hypothetical protein F4780DRAFT_796768 [Xylariomycetidae sp. FL0641]|nr:hypothetical protein F4780DRAFT_796768 [Xylariomycetidae sp. FL0641]